MPDLKMVVGLWAWPGDLRKAKDRVACESSVNLVITIAGAVDEVEQLTKAAVVQQHEATARTNGGATPPTNGDDGNGDDDDDDDAGADDERARAVAPPRR
jgi:hypothetical protein